MAQAEYSNMSLFERLARIRNMCETVKKSKQGYNYTYSDITDILASVTAGMKKYNVGLIPVIVGETSSVEKNEIKDVKFDKLGNTKEKISTEFLFKSQMKFTWLCNDNPDDKVEVDWFATGSMADPAQAMGAALTYTQRQFLTAYFQIAQSDLDPDAYRTKQKNAEEAEDKMILTSLISEFDKLAVDLINAVPEKKNDVKDFCCKYIKGGNYKNIKDNALIAKMIEEFKKDFLNESEQPTTEVKKAEPIIKKEPKPTRIIMEEPKPTRTKVEEK